MKHTVSYIILLSFILISSNSASADDSQLSEIEIQESSDWEIIVIDQSTSLPNGNETFSDGDYVSISVKVSNTGNQSINGSWKLKLLSEGVWHSSVGQNETWDANDDLLSEITLGPLIEGIMTLKFEISIDNSTSNISETIQITVSPNPLHFSGRSVNRNNRRTGVYWRYSYSFNIGGKRRGFGRISNAHTLRYRFNDIILRGACFD